MKKVLLILAVVLMVSATGCKKDKKSKALNYNDSNPIEMALSGTSNDFDYKINVSSDYDITYTAINPSGSVITVSSDGKIHGKNVGSAKVKMDNGYENITVDVNVRLFIEPTFEFGCNSSRIRDLYGRPYSSALVGDTLLIYQYTANHGYSYTCGQMDFFFDRGEYFESDVYIRKFAPNPEDEYLLNSYLNNNFTLIPELCNDTLNVYRNIADTTIICGKFDAHNDWNEWCLFYFRQNQDRSLANFLKNRPRSSKLRY